MYKRCLDVLRDIIRNKWEINRSEDKDLWGHYQEIKASDEFGALRESFGFDMIEEHDHVYLISREDGLFSKTRAERRYDAGAQYNEELFLLDFATLILLSLLLSGEEETLMVRDFVTLGGYMEVLQKAIVRLKKEQLVIDIGHQRVKGTKRLETTAKYMLRKERAAEIMGYISKEI